MYDILVTGANGQLGREIKTVSNKFINWNILFTDIDELDITNIEALEKVFKENELKFVINAAAFTAVDLAESENERAYSINAEAVGYIAKLCTKYNVRLIHISTDYVYDGKTYIPYKEDDTVNPLSVYGMTKLQGEQKILEEKTDAIIFRTSWLYATHGKNFVKTILKYGTERESIRIVFDQIGTPTYAADLAEVIFTIIENTTEEPEFFKSGIYHYSNEGVTSWYDFAVEVLDFADIYCPVIPIETAEYTTAAVRPNFSVMNKNKVKLQFDISIPHWKESLHECLEILMGRMHEAYSAAEFDAVSHSELNLEEMNLDK